MKYTDKQIEDLLEGIYSGEYTNEKLPEDLYFAIADYLKEGLYKGFESDLTTVAADDLELLIELRENIYMFSGAKTYSQVIEMRDLIAEANSYKEFKDAAIDIYDKYNLTWLATEYDTAIGQAQSAVSWNEFERNKDVLPNLVYSTIGDACDICAPLDGMCAPVDDPVWNNCMPLNHFNCECIVEATDDETKEVDVTDVLEKMDDTFKMNPGKDGYIFKDDHPYFEVARGDKAFAERNFDLPIPDNDNE